MDKNFANMSLIDIAYEMVKESTDGLEINELLKKTLEAAGLDATDADLLSNLYMEICTSSKFVYLETRKWDLKTRHSLDEFDKDGSKFNQVSEDEANEEAEDQEDDEDLDEDDEDDEDEDDEDDEDDEESDDEEENNYEDSYSDSDDDLDYTDDSEDDLTEFDEDKYNSTMDEYEDKYDN